ncbi:MAG: ATP-binding protein [bacterium]
MLRGSKAKSEIFLPPDLWPFEIDKGKISQCFGNLIVNASQAMPQGGTIEILGENAVIEAESGLPVTCGEYIKILIKDQGAGIPKEHLSRIFDPYFTTKKDGTGLGLATTYSIIKKTWRVYYGGIPARRRDNLLYLPSRFNQGNVSGGAY